MYIEKFYRALDQADRSSQIRLLKGTVFEMIAQLYVASRSGLISEAEHRQLAGSLLRLKEVRSMLTSKDRLALSIFHTYQAAKVHIPGAHFAVKSLLLI